MAGCYFDSPSLVTSLAAVNAVPTFAFNTANTNYFGLPGSFISGNDAVCSFPTQSVSRRRTSTYAITPIIVTTSGPSAKTTTCSVLRPASIGPGSSGSTTYSGIECPSATNNQFSPGTYTLRFNQPNINGVPSIAPHVFVLASPTFIIDSVTATILQTTTASVIASTSTVTDFSSTVTETPASGIQTITSTAPSTVVTSTLTQPCISSISSGASVIASSSTTAIAPISTLKVSLDGACGTKSNQTCLGSTFGQCCSSYGYCGTTDLYCQTTEGCQSSYGNCTTPSPVSSGALPTSTLKTSLDGSCGGANGFVCPGSKFGDCCSPYGWCGSTTTHCGAGCQLPFGTCNTTSPTDTAPLPTSTNKVSLDGTCGGTAAQTCRGSDFGNCCSQFGFCGKTDTYCATGCQADFGTCTTTLNRRISHPHLVPALDEAAKRAAAAAAAEKKRAIGGAGPDFTYPPVPHTTVTQSVGGVVTVTLSAGVSTVTVTGVRTTTDAGAGAGQTVTVIETAGTGTAVVTVGASGVCGAA